jgi:hypothetical protein
MCPPQPASSDENCYVETQGASNRRHHNQSADAGRPSGSERLRWSTCSKHKLSALCDGHEAVPILNKHSVAQPPYAVHAFVLSIFSTLHPPCFRKGSLRLHSGISALWNNHLRRLHCLITLMHWWRGQDAGCCLRTPSQPDQLKPHQELCDGHARLSLWTVKAASNAPARAVSRKTV